MIPWGDYYAGDCVHGEPASTCRTCVGAQSGDAMLGEVLFVVLLAFALAALIIP